MSTTFAQTRPTTLSVLSPELTAVGLFSLVGMALSAAVLSYVSFETISVMFSSVS